MAAIIEKGKVTAVNGSSADVLQTSDRRLLYKNIVLPWFLRTDGSIAKDTEVIFAVFRDSTGIILSRADGSRGKE